MAMLFLFTIVTVVVLHNVLHVPPAYGMMGGLLYLKLYGYYMSLKSRAWWRSYDEPPGEGDDPYDFDVFSKIGQAEWDTLFFFYGVILTVGGLGFIGYLGIASEAMYGQLGYTNANILVGVLSAIVDNIPVMFAVLTMSPPMDDVQWLLVTLTAGVGGSLFAVGPRVSHVPIAAQVIDEKRGEVCAAVAGAGFPGEQGVENIGPGNGGVPAHTDQGA